MLDEEFESEFTFRESARADARLRLSFINWLSGAEMHWFFVQGADAIAGRLYVPGTLSLLNGIEATLRITIHQLSDPNFDEELSCYQTLSNQLIRKGKEAGLPIQFLAFPGETDFEEKLHSPGKQKSVEIVRQRNNLCHGNVLEYVDDELGKGNAFFTPECLRCLSSTLLQMSTNWTHALGNFRRERFGSKVAEA